MNYQRDDKTGFAIRNGLINKNYPPIPRAELFLNARKYGYEKPVTIHEWQWSITFNCWSALVTFEDGWRGFTYPKR